MPKLVLTKEEILENIATLVEYLDENSKHKKFASELLKNGKVFVGVFHGNSWEFGPSRFVGYARNSQHKHSTYRKINSADGKVTNPAIRKIVGSPIEFGDAGYDAVEKAFLASCEQLGIEPNKVARRYWVIKTQLIASDDARRKCILDMKHNTLATHINSNGQTVERKIKNKDLRLSSKDLEDEIATLLDRQNSRCALTGLKLDFSDPPSDLQLKPSLDRIDSDGHYEKGNLQVVCRFVNFWKSNQANDEFQRLLAMVIGLGDHAANKST